MSRQLEQHIEQRSARRHSAIVRAVEYELAESISQAGGELTGFGAKIGPAECLITVKVRLAGRAQVAFIGAEDLGSALIKAVSEAKRDKLRWRDDKYGG